ncbi:MAG: response regulator [Candidatus Omnitrophota bacterium]
MEKKKIMVIDDEKDFLKMVKLNLEEAGAYEVKTEDNSENAFNAIKVFKPDIILVDVMMPGMDGGDIVHKLESDDELKDIPVVFVTATVTKGEVSAAGGVIGKRNFIAKPVGAQELIYSIEKYLNK